MNKDLTGAVIALIFVLPLFCVSGIFLLTGSVIKAFGYLLSLNAPLAWSEMRDITESVKSYWFQN